MSCMSAGSRRCLIGALVVAALACSGDAPRESLTPLRTFLEENQGEWNGVLRETPALEKRVMVETPLRLRIRADGALDVEYPQTGCRGSLVATEDKSLPTRPDDARFYQNVSNAGNARCPSGPVRLIRSGESLEFRFLGDPLRRIRATLERTS